MTDQAKHKPKKGKKRGKPETDPKDNHPMGEGNGDHEQAKQSKRAAK